MLYELVRGTRPFHAEGIMAIFYKITHDDPAFDFPYTPEYRALIPILAKALAKDAAARYQNAAEFADALRPFAAGVGPRPMPAGGPPAPPPPGPPRPPRGGPPPPPRPLSPPPPPPPPPPPSAPPPRGLRPPPPPPPHDPRLLRRRLPHRHPPLPPRRLPPAHPPRLVLRPAHPPAPRHCLAPR